MKKLFVTLSAMLIAAGLVGLPIIAATPLDGVYRIVNVQYSTSMTENFISHETSCSTSKNGSMNQLWIIAAAAGTDKYTLQNVYTGRYMQNVWGQYTTHTTGTSAHEGTIKQNSAVNSCYDFTFGSGYLHCQGGSAIVNWYQYDGSSNAASAWTLTKIDMTQAQIDSARAEYNALQEATSNVAKKDSLLQKYFSDRACTTLKDSWASDEALRAAMAADGLATALQDMAVKVKNNSWGTMEEHFRVQEYSIAAAAENWVSYSRQSAQSNMKNPTGIIASSRNIMYVMVDNPIPANARLALQELAGEGYLTGVGGTELHQGLNVIITGSDNTTFFMMYTCNSYNGGEYIDISDKEAFPDIKVHIEGGSVDGFYTMGDGEEMYNWLVANHQHSYIQLKGEMVMIHIFSKDFRAYSTSATLDDGIGSWDWVERWQYALLGFLNDPTDSVTQEYIDGSCVEKPIVPKYYNSIHLAFGNNTGFMDAGSWRTHYVSGCWSGMLKREPFLFGGACSMWGAAHEIGHTNQGVFNMPGGTEVTNNLFANVVNFMTGYGDSRGNTNIDVANYFQNRKSWYNYDIWAQTRMYYKLFLYYHAAKNNIQFFPTLFEDLRHDPLRFGNAGSTTNPTLGENMHLKFYEKCCDAAHEDLTEFFETYGFFIPMDLLLVGDYSNHYVTSTQEMIDAAKARVKAKGYPKNSAVIFIDDRSEDIPVGGLAKAVGKIGMKVNNAYTPSSLGYQTGSFTRYMKDSLTTATDYTIEQTDRTITFSGSGAQGFLIYDKDGKLYAFTNTSSYTFPENYDGAPVTIVAMGSDQDTLFIPGFDPEEAVSGALRSTKTAVEKFLALEDTDGKHPGYYPTEVLVTLKDLYAQAEDALAKSEVDKYGTLNRQLLEEKANLQNNPDCKTPLRKNRYYRLRNYSYTTRYMTKNGNGVATNTDASSTNTANWWRFYETGTANRWRIANADGTYIGTIASSTQATCQATQESNALLFNSTDNGNGTFYFCTPAGGNTGLHSAQNASYNVVGWCDCDASRWYIEEVQDEEKTLEKDALKELIDKTNTVMNQAATITPLTLQHSDASNDFYLFSNADYNKLTGNTDGGGIPALLDNNYQTYFHSLYGTTTVDEDHYLQANLGEGRGIQDFSFSYTTRHNTANNKPTTIIVSASNDSTTAFTEIATFTDQDATNPLPNSKSETSESWKSDTIHANTTYQYLRFTVSTTNTGAKCGTHVFFSMAAFNIVPMYPYIVLNTEEYPKVTLNLVKKAYSRSAIAQNTYNDVAATTEQITADYDSLYAAYIALKNVTSPEVVYEYYFNDVKKGEETKAITIGEAYPAPTLAVPYGVVAPETPSGVTTGCETIRIDLVLNGDIPFQFSTGFNDAKWYSWKMRCNPSAKGGYARFDGTNYTEKYLDEAPTAAEYCYAFIGDPWGFKVLTPNNAYFYNGGSNNELVTEKSTQAVATTFDIKATTNATVIWGSHIIYIDGKTGTINDVNGKLGFWGNESAYADPGSQITFTHVDKTIYHVCFENAPEGAAVTYAGTTITPASTTRAFSTSSTILEAMLTVGEVSGYRGSVSMDGKTITVRYTPCYDVAIGASGYATFYNDVVTRIPAGAQAFYVSDYTGTYTEGVLTLAPAYNYVAAGQGVIVSGTAGQTYTFVEDADADVEAPAKNYLVGYNETQEARGFEEGDGWYYLSTAGYFKKLVNASYAMPAHKAFLYLLGSEVKSFSFDDETGVGNEPHPYPLPSREGNSYNLAGQRVNTLQKGVNIVNGKKVLY